MTSAVHLGVKMHSPFSRCVRESARFDKCVALIISRARCLQRICTAIVDYSTKIPHFFVHITKIARRGPPIRHGGADLACRLPRTPLVHKNPPHTNIKQYNSKMFISKKNMAKMLG